MHAGTNLNHQWVGIPVLTSHQIRGARGMLNWSARMLAERSGVHLTMVQRLERVGGRINCSLETAESIRAVLEAAGIEFHGLSGIKLNDTNVGGAKPNEPT